MNRPTVNWLIATAGFMVTAGAIFLQPTIYTARARLELPHEETPPVGVAELVNIDRQNLNRLLPVDAVSRLGSVQVLQQALGSCGLAHDFDSVSRTSKRVRSRLVAGTNTIEVQVEEFDPAMARRIIEAVIAAADAVRKANERDLVRRLSEGLREEAQKISSETTTLVGELQTARNGSAQMELTLIERDRGELASLELEKKQIVLQLDLLRVRGGNAPTKMLALTPGGGITAAGDLSQQAQRVTLEARMAATRQIYGPNSREVRFLQSEQSARDASARRELADQQMLLENRLRALQERGRELGDELEVRSQTLLQQHARQFTPEYTLKSLRLAALEIAAQSIGRRQRELELYYKIAPPSLIVLDPPHLSDSSSRKTVALTIAACGTLLLAMSLHLLTDRKALREVI